MGDPSARRRAAAQRMRDDLADPWTAAAPLWAGPWVVGLLVAVAVMTATLDWLVSHG